MGQIIYMEQVKIERDQQIRSYALKHFPWEEMDLVQQYMIDPLSENWSKQKQIIVTEASFRLVFEAYVLGLQGQKKKIGANKRLNHFEYDHHDDDKLDQLIKKVMEDFSFYHLFPYQTLESIQIMFFSLAQEWYLRGWMSDYNRR